MAYLKTPFTDLGGHMLNIQAQVENPLCRTLEMQFFFCMEKRGYPNFRRDCKDEYDDYMECLTQRKARERLICMFNERQRQFQAGERKEEFMPVPPKHTSRGTS